MRAVPARELAVVGVMLAVLGGLGAVLQASGLRWQHTESLPRGLYRLDPAGQISRGSIVLWCLDSARGRWARARGYLTSGACPGEVEPIGKMVLAVAGDTVDWGRDGVRLNGRLVTGTRPVYRDHVGRSLRPVPAGRYLLVPGRMWVYSPYTERSIDSRYVGAIPIGWVKGVLQPRWVVTDPNTTSALRR